MKAIIEYEGIKYLMTIAEAEDVLKLIKRHSKEWLKEDYERLEGSNSSRYTTRFTVYPVEELSSGLTNIKLLTDEQYGIAKLRYESRGDT